MIQGKVVAAVCVFGLRSQGKLVRCSWWSVDQVSGVCNEPTTGRYPRAGVKDKGRGVSKGEPTDALCMTRRVWGFVCVSLTHCWKSPLRAALPNTMQVNGKNQHSVGADLLLLSSGYCSLFTFTKCKCHLKWFIYNINRNVLIYSKEMTATQFLNKIKLSSLSLKSVGINLMPLT